MRRGADPAKIYSIAISGNDLLAVTSDKGNVHVYSLDSNPDIKTEEKSSNTKSYFGFMKSILPTYFSSEWSFAQFNFCQDTKAVYTACAFTTENKLVLISIKGDYYLLEVNKAEKIISSLAHLTIKTD